MGFISFLILRFACSHTSTHTIDLIPMPLRVFFQLSSSIKTESLKKAQDTRSFNGLLTKMVIMKMRDLLRLPPKMMGSRQQLCYYQ